ncbi:LIM domain-containing protein [Teratosphaeria destructans]|uniref:LIM domain-containing protein n=1 Tax=Teratosphaeria destructans TaxID=418781 RepID=A0A9W7SWA5_9PEZI|nr:LIM domain-containing protein [Teratosphaeria destructans]
MGEQQQRKASDERPALQKSDSMPVMSSTTSKSEFSKIKSPFIGRPLARPPSATPPEPRIPLETSRELRRPNSMVYLENGTRWMEKQEARSLRMALQDMDLEKEKRIHADAQDEAAELVWKHKYPEAAKAKEEAPFANPDLGSMAQQRDYRSHLRKNSYQRSHSRDPLALVDARADSEDSTRPADHLSMNKQRIPDGDRRKVSPPARVVSIGKTRSPSGKSYGALASSVAKDIAKAHRKASGESNKRIMSGDKKMYMHKNDRIFEDPHERVTPDLSPASGSRVASATIEEEPVKRSTEPVKRTTEPIKPAITPVQPSSTQTPSATPSLVRKNPFARVRMQYQDRPAHSSSAPVLPVAKKVDLPSPAERAVPSSSRSIFNRVEIQRNPPSQSRNAGYTSNDSLPSTPPRSRDADGKDLEGTPTKDGKEIRSDDIRSATSKQRKDRSPNLPQPTIVSDKPGRPIVSFKQDWKPKEVVMEEVHTAPVKKQESPTKSSFNPLPLKMPPKIGSSESKADRPAPPVPTICTPDDAQPTMPSIVLPEEPDFAEAGLQSAPVTPGVNIQPPPLPAINVESSDPVPSSPSSRNLPKRPLPSPIKARPDLHHANTSPLPKSKSTPHYTPSIRQSGALCAHCVLPIAGRILSAAGERFHPQCFVCHQCHTNLELVAFYPEPDRHRSERLDRIRARQTGMDVEVPEGWSVDDVHNQILSDGDETLRFYCHLDYHELFSPRCKSCKTPIEGEVIVACGAEWHQGHFFCAQCGDPFDSSTPFVEKDGYAWCVGCHTNRYSSKCRKCRKPVTDVVVKALGFDWHGGCFVCTECNGDFEDGRYFLRGESEDPVCVKCEEKRLKA